VGKPISGWGLSSGPGENGSPVATQNSILISRTSKKVNLCKQGKRKGKKRGRRPTGDKEKTKTRQTKAPHQSGRLQRIGPMTVRRKERRKKMGHTNLIGGGSGKGSGGNPP